TAFRVEAARRRQNENVRAIELLFLQAEHARAAGKPFVDHLAVEGDHARTEFFEFAREQNAAFGKFFAREVVYSFGWPFDQISKPYAEFDNSPVVFVSERLGNHAGFIQERPKFVAATRVIMTDAGGTLSGIASHDH